MRTTRTVLKLLIFGLLLFVLSAGYRLFGEKQEKAAKGGIFGIGSARADAPPPPGGVEGTDISGSICDGCSAAEGAGTGSAARG